MHGTSLLTTPAHFGPVLLPKVSKNDDEECCFLKQVVNFNGTFELKIFDS